MFAEEVASQVSSLLNSLGREGVKVFLEKMNRDHRTLQQSFTRLCVGWLELQATKKDGEFDLRNQASVELAKKFVAGVEDRHLPFI